MEISHAEISDLQNFIVELNSAQESVVVVEGKRDSTALKKLGYEEKILEFHSFGGITKFADSVSCHKNLIVLFDFDRKGKYLTRRIIMQLEPEPKLISHIKRNLPK